ncbi:two component transcriptional regulator, winged helix family [Ferrimonas balearica DSM 9799]|uniref:Two component transcriptional regulator, winged helix family n=1 Tax=Ferrimonas balearica (strain DSM 9799 / CCM 4581 / KCTC 23876 / PAT) TaxID=550540 RepID=E1SVL3_FERBD|nr:response regulator [Ferrimonas balearica]MBY6016827.1 response regulator [Halomonas denitrificans]ADN76344.1 two component transcriptional regulator, winged helix family [Ferrimonas balearica DSM 9799]MBW3139251.1 response regulator [Ferrimonas balearica]MBY5980849.1 response regulator [Ferrimonas balearica]MBY6094883.1 response regulator [Ferrimonas balearica]
MQILVIEDDPLLCHHLKVRLSELGNQVQASQTASEGEYLANNYPLDIAVVDLGLPDESGLSLIQRLRDQGKAFPILILTARDSWQDKVEGLNAGADDYLVKPFRIEELMARLNALVRRSAGFIKPEISCGSLKMDLTGKSVTLAGDLLELTAFEYQILEYLMRHHQQVISKQRLLDVLYEDREGDPNTVEVMISRLRKKLVSGGMNNPIVTIRGQGYRFNQACQ